MGKAIVEDMHVIIRMPVAFQFFVHTKTYKREFLRRTLPGGEAQIAIDRYLGQA